VKPNSGLFEENDKILSPYDLSDLSTTAFLHFLGISRRKQKLLHILLQIYEQFILGTIWRDRPIDKRMMTGRFSFFGVLYWVFGMGLSVDGDADAAVEARIRIGWNNFRQLVPLLTNKKVLLIMRGRLYSSCVRSSMLYGSETWPISKENVVALQRAEMRMARFKRQIPK